MQNFRYETNSGLTGAIQAEDIATAHQRLAAQFGAGAIEVVEAEAKTTTKAASKRWSAYWDRVRALPPR
jgi:hypothetical protein